MLKKQTILQIKNVYTANAFQSENGTFVGAGSETESEEVSEVIFIDLDGDGSSEMITIKPFHGSTINVYKKLQNQWELLFSDSLAFGHGLNCGVFNNEAVIVVGNRTDSLALELFRAENLTRGIVQRKLIEGAVGPTQTQVFSFGGTDYILSANQKKNEVALYSGRLE